VKKQTQYCLVATGYVPQATSPRDRYVTTTATQEIKKSQMTMQSTVKLLHWNADGLKTKYGELENCLKELDIDVAVIRETKLQKDKTPPVIGYTAARQDRPSTKEDAIPSTSC